MCTGVHEGAHFVVACRLGLPVFLAFVRVPRKQPKAGFAGALGSVAAGGTLIQDAVFASAAVLAQQFLPTDAEQAHEACESDYETFQKWADRAVNWGSSAVSPISREGQYKFLDGVLLMVRDDWKVIDAVAACLLHCSDSTGVLSTALTARLTALVRGTPAGISRTPQFDGPDALCECLGIEGPQIQVSREHPFVRLTAPPGYRSPLLAAA